MVKNCRRARESEVNVMPPIAELKYTAMVATDKAATSAPSGPQTIAERFCIDGRMTKIGYSRTEIVVRSVDPSQTEEEERRYHDGAVILSVCKTYVVN
jgi:hypothetical protein